MGYQKIQNFMLPKFVEMGFKMSRKKVVSKKYGAKFELIGFCTFRQCPLLITFVRNIFLNPYGNNLNRHKILCSFTPIVKFVGNFSDVVVFVLFAIFECICFL
jgi:hypothetical protein